MKSPTAFVSLFPIHSPRRPPTRRRTLVCTHHSPSLSDLQSLGVLTLHPRRSDYNLGPLSARTQVEPELIALVGVSHHPSAENRSPIHAASAIAELHADAVVLELCRARAPLLNDPPPPQALPVWARFLPRFSPLTSLLAPPAAQRGHAVGAEFRAAAQAAEQVGASLVLGDRPLRHTLTRAWDSTSWGDRFVLAASLLRAALVGDPANTIRDQALRGAVVSGVSEDGVVERYVRILGESFPGLRRTLVEERDLYLAWVLKRSRAVSGKKCVVGVVGKAHVEGVVKALEEDDRRRSRGDKPLLAFRDIVSNN